MLDPNAVSDIYCIHNGAPLSGIAAFDINDGSRIDIGKYDHVVLLVGMSTGTTAGAITITPKDSSSQNGPEFPLDGTGGRPDYRRSFTGGSDTGSRQVVMRVANMRRYLNLTVSLAATGNARCCIYLLGFGKAATALPQPIDTNLAAIGVT
jgi:hypothetical protein